MIDILCVFISYPLKFFRSKMKVLMDLSYQIKQPNLCPQQQSLSTYININQHNISLIKGEQPKNIQFAYTSFNQLKSLPKMHHFLTGQPLEQPPGVPHQLWISGVHFARNLDALTQHKIGAVCSVTAQHVSFPPQIKHISFEIEDRADEDISSIFEESYQFIEKNRKQTNVLVHCTAGISRSATIVAYYLMRRHRWKVEECLKRMRKSRGVIGPNVGFYRQLLMAQSGMGLGLIRGRF